MTSRARLLTFGLAAAWLAIGYLNVARGTSHAGAGYRFWSFQHHCYSDVIALHGDRYLGGGRPLPYLEDRIEYPVLLGIALWLPSFAPGGALGHFTVSYAVLALCLFAALLALERLPGARPFWLGATPALVYYAGLNWDLLPIALLCGALLALARDRPGAGGALTALGTSAKLFPGVLAPPALLALAGDGARAPLLRFGAGLAAALLAVNLPFALAAPAGWSWFFRFNAGRGAENSIWDALGVGRGPLLEVLSTGPMLLAVALACAAAWRAARSGGDAGRAVRLGVALALTAWIATNKVWSPQYALYGFLAGALAAAPAGLFLVLCAASVADFHIAFEVRARRWEPWFRDHVFHPDGVVRSLLWLLLAAWIARELWRCARAAPAEAHAEAVSSPSTR
ncbi:integral membrane protein-like protein [Anaeromyxobacter dehalogenans 2CP-1]|uniref:Integral membrane protein-like protein n=1 Tax=Anaeromyxobacter dehalogenans (strain ATCC BAA-258 / DSM 21875 / 2CP-1) TaxID=455488 RepID=B8J8U6_ANAD2|nr:membrane protein [Anaeromyxobacter dehalogenans]ACL63544.1 integral membrane protein-like protein [Anaeromyxobacter dehalogenans 2CP-1]